jgi:hypothetical protein
MPGGIAEALIHELFNGRTKCGPKHQYDAYHPRVIDNFMPNPGCPYIIPDVTFHPEIVVALDFNYEATDQVRVLSEDRLRKIALDLLNYFAYYFEYVLSYGKNSPATTTQLGAERSRILANLDEISLFLNQFINYFITAVSVSRASGEIGTASITLKDQMNFVENQKVRLFIDKSVNILNQLFMPMLPVMIWARGRLYTEWYFPLFDGLITSVTDSDDSGFEGIVLNCRDVLELARISYEMVNPAILQVKEKYEKQQTAINIFSKPFYGIDHFQIISSMFTGGAVKWDSVKGRIVGIDIGNSAQDKKNEKSSLLSFDGLGNFKTASDFIDTPDFDLFDVADNKAIYHPRHSKNSLMGRFVREVSHKYRPRVIESWGTNLTPYRGFETKSVDTFTSTFDSRLSILQGTSELVYYSLYVDGYGNVQYHPMRLSLKYLNYDMISWPGGARKTHAWAFPGAQIIGYDDLINSSSTINVEELVN